MSDIEKKSLLVVDDDPDIRQLLSEFLTQHGYVVHMAKDGKAMAQQLVQHSVDMVILDIMMPGEDGISLCRRLRAESTMPILMLTAITEDVERILALEIGADDYLSKPFNPRELLARIKAILRRTENVPSSNDQPKQNVFHFDGWQLDESKRQLLSPDHVEITISTGEYSLLQVFLQHPQEVLSRDRLLTLTKNRTAEPYDRSIDIQVSRLRQKLEADPKQPEMIKTVRGGGYILAVDVRVQPRNV